MKPSSLVFVDQNRVYARRVLIAFVSFFAAFIFVDIVFVVLAVRTYTGVVTEQAYEKGLSYNRIIKEAKEQVGRGWVGKISVKEGVLSIHLKDRSGVSIGKRDVRVLFINPRNARDDFSRPLFEQTFGVYTAVLPTSIKGRWNLRFLVDTGRDQKPFQIYETVIFP